MMFWKRQKSKEKDGDLEPISILSYFNYSLDKTEQKRIPGNLPFLLALGVHADLDAPFQ
jgi:hypothetical protein